MDLSVQPISHFARDLTGERGRVATPEALCPKLQTATLASPAAVNQLLQVPEEGLVSPLSINWIIYEWVYDQITATEILDSGCMCVYTVFN